MVSGRRLGSALVVALAAACGGGDGGDVDAASAPDRDVCDIADGTGVSFDANARSCDRLSSYRLFVGDGSTQEPNDRVLPYDVNNALYADYAAKYRFLWLPEGTSMTYDDTGNFQFPVGAVLIKTFAYPADITAPDGDRQLLETRLLYLTSEQWDVVTYVWDDSQTEAFRQIAGDRVSATWVHTDGATRTNEYSIPNKNQCKNCHEEQDDVVSPIGLKARHLNREFLYSDGVANQLERWAELGYLTGLPDIAMVPRAPVWNDDTTGSLDERARAWLDINCAHCHNPRGAARTSGLDLLPTQVNPYEYGVCKAPIAAGGGSGGLRYNIVPGQPDESILIYRLESDEIDVRMPEVGRQLEDEEGVALMRAWITALPGECGGQKSIR